LTSRGKASSPRTGNGSAGTPPGSETLVQNHVLDVDGEPPHGHIRAKASDALVREATARADPRATLVVLEGDPRFYGRVDIAVAECAEVPPSFERDIGELFDRMSTLSPRVESLLDGMLR
jgi:hypothetical protein